MTSPPLPAFMLAELERLRPSIPPLDAIRSRATQRGHGFRICRADPLEPATEPLPALPAR
jgi:hypothetical protein